ncbi:hypothetical protein QJS04_geneDACA017289 [Acorus gramineus]|uniref:Aminotransferase-like plant mobile domain-containing protein n=1 Tax=Acorus gramineus TaxID=55184 RepID=A0AAV9A2X2_ACOGR|nr:hypothetical protein QJS04_geneDACA017289 [Acorus gramineus]
MARKPRIPLTTSLRRRQSERLAKHASSGSVVSHVEQPDVDDPEVEGEEVEEDESTLKIVDSDIDPNSLNGPFPGGPETGAVLVDYRHHIAYRVWNRKGDRTLRCRQPTKTMEGWNVHDESTILKNTVKQSGLWPLVEYSFHAPNRHLISSMVERWHPETNTFHLPFGEMTITLDDVTQIIGIPVMGRAVYGSTSMDIEDASKLVFKSLNLPMNEIHEELHLHNGSALTLNWLRDKLVLKSTSLPEERIHFVHVTTACQFLEDLLDRGSTFTSVQRPILEGMMNFLQHGTPLPHSPVLERRSPITYRDAYV